MSDYYKDPRYVDIGDLPTGFAPYVNIDKIYVRPFSVRELALLYNGGSSNVNTDVSHVLRAIDMVTSCNIYDLTDGDFSYIMAWLRMHSYPKAPSQVSWTCIKENLVDKDSGEICNDKSAEELNRLNIQAQTCNNKNVELVYNSKIDILSLDDDNLNIPYDYVDFPRISTYSEFLRIKENDPDSSFEAETARWVKCGTTLKEKIGHLNALSVYQYTKLLECKKTYDHSVKETMSLKCRTCNNKVSYVSKPDMLTFFADNSEQNILDMQYFLLSELKMQPDENMPAKTLLYHHSCLVKDKQKEEELERLKKSIRNKV